jgi:hypothetical protein
LTGNISAGSLLPTSMTKCNSQKQLEAVRRARQGYPRIRALEKPGGTSTSRSQDSSSTSGYKPVINLSGGWGGGGSNSQELQTSLLPVKLEDVLVKLEDLPVKLEDVPMQLPASPVRMPSYASSGASKATTYEMVARRHTLAVWEEAERTRVAGYNTLAFYTQQSLTKKQREKDFRDKQMSQTYAPTPSNPRLNTQVLTPAIARRRPPSPSGLECRYRPPSEPLQHQRCLYRPVAPCCPFQHFQIPQPFQRYLPSR